MNEVFMTESDATVVNSAVSSSRKSEAMMGNKHAVIHGLYRSFRTIDERTVEGRAIRDTELALAEALGGDVTPQQAAVNRSIAISAWRCAGIGEQMIDEQRKPEPDYDRVARWDQEYRRWSGHLREGLRMIGLSRVPAALPSLQDYLRSREAAQPSKGE